MHLTAASNSQAGPALTGDVDLIEALGAEQIVHFTIDARRVRAERAAGSDTETVTVSGEGVARVHPTAPVKPGERCTFAINTSGMQFFDPTTSAAIWD